MQHVRFALGFDDSKEVTFKRLERQMIVLNGQLGTDYPADQQQQMDTLQMLRSNLLSMVLEMRSEAEAGTKCPMHSANDTESSVQSTYVKQMIKKHVQKKFCVDRELSEMFASLCRATHDVLESGLGLFVKRRSGAEDAYDYEDVYPEPFDANNELDAEEIHHAAYT